MQEPYWGGGWKLQTSSQTEIEVGIILDSHTQAEVHRNRVGGQVGIQGQACQEGSLEVGSLEGVLAFRGAQNRSRQGDLKANWVRHPRQVRYTTIPGGIIPIPRPAGRPRPGPLGNCNVSHE